jgi:hypothetical protein
VPVIFCKPYPIKTEVAAELLRKEQAINDFENRTILSSFAITKLFVDSIRPLPERTI